MSDQPLGNQRRFRLAFDLDRHVPSELHAVGNLLHGSEDTPQADSGSRRHGGRKSHPIESIVDRPRIAAADSYELTLQLADQSQRKEAVSDDRSIKRFVSGPVGIRMIPL